MNLALLCIDTIFVNLTFISGGLIGIVAQKNTPSIQNVNDNVAILFNMIIPLQIIFKSIVYIYTPNHWFPNILRVDFAILYFLP